MSNQSTFQSATLVDEPDYEPYQQFDAEHAQNLAKLRAELEASKANLAKLRAEQVAFEAARKVSHAELQFQISRAEENLAPEDLRAFRLAIFMARHTGDIRAKAEIAAQDKASAAAYCAARSAVTASG